MEHHSDNATNGDDIIYTVASDGSGQRHIFARGGDDIIHMGFSTTTRYSHGHHVRGDRTDETAREGADIFNFTDLENVRHIVVGRIDDFDASRDEIQIEGKTLDLYDLPEQVRIVAYAGLHNDPDPALQQWLLIETDAGGTIFYALEGARVDRNGDGGANGGAQEHHFIPRQVDLPDFADLEDVAFIDLVNVVPDGATPDGGIVINDVDKFFLPVRGEALGASTVIEGSPEGDLIAAGLNDDVVAGGSGNDQIWGGSGSDTIKGDAGDDVLYGGVGNDELWGNGGDELLFGDSGDDNLIGGWGKDTLEGGEGADKLSGSLGKDLIRGGSDNDKLYGRRGADTLRGGDGDDKLNGGRQNDKLTGGEGADQFIFKGIHGRDVVTDFEPGIDKLLLDGLIGITARSSSTLVTTEGGEIILVGIVTSDFGPGDLIFG